MTNLTTAFVIVLSINIFLMFSQAALDDMNPEQQFYDETGSIIAGFDSGDYVLNDTDPAGALPSGDATGVGVETGNVFTDTFSAIKSWLLQSTGLSYLFSLLGAPYRFLAALGLPQQFTFGIGALWYAVTLYLVVAFIMGRDT